MSAVSANLALDRIATIDMAPLNDGSEAGVRQVADAFRAVFERVGFFILINHGIDPALIKRTFAEAERFLAQPMKAKLRVMMNEHNNGYMAMDRYNVRTSRVSEEAKPDRNEAFFMKRERDADDPLLKSGRRFCGDNVWPENLPGFRETLLEYTDAVDTMAKRLLRPLAVSLDLPGDTFDAGFQQTQFSLRLSHYPPVEAREARLYGIAPHTDSSFMTFLAQSGVPGLQIRVGEEDWLDVPYVPNSFVVNSGDMMHRWTNGRYKSTPHRALPPVGRDRYAIPYFFGPHFDTMIDCLPTCQGPDNPPQFPPITYGDYMTWWYGSNYDAKDQADLAGEAAE
jgi:isopenicillin N synthase-like dioxygenase